MSATLPTTHRALLTAFRSLPAPALAEVPGTYEAAFVGSAAIRAIAPTATRLAGLPRWYGKRFAERSPAADALDGINLTRATDSTHLDERLPMTLAIEPSWLDGRPCAAVRYAPGSGLPWRYIRDELRVFDEECYLALTHAVAPSLRALATPFVLRRR